MTNPMLAELDAVVRLRDAARANPNDQYTIEGSEESVAYIRSLIGMFARNHTTLADMAKRLEAAERDAAYGRALIEAMDELEPLHRGWNQQIRGRAAEILAGWLGEEVAK